MTESPDKRKRGWRAWVSVLVLPLVLYVASYGPALRTVLLQRARAIGAAPPDELRQGDIYGRLADGHNTFYAPVDFAVRAAPQPIRRAWDMYVEFWCADL